MSDFDNNPNPWAASNVTDDFNFQQNQTPVNVPDYFVSSILVTLFCCLPLGIPAIIFSAKARSLKAAGQYQAAVEQCNKAKLFTYLALGLGLLAIIGQIALQIAIQSQGLE